MATGGYQTPSLDEPTGFGSDSVESSSDRISGVASAPLFGIDYKRYAWRETVWSCAKDGTRQGSRGGASKVNST